tara:strand:- start:381 stop:965 length:585 start_codon:yes stop_codon:yes gene_type:complete
MKKKQIILIGLDNDLIDQFKSSKDYKLIGTLDKNIKTKGVIGNDYNFSTEKQYFYILTLDNPQKKEEVYEKFYSKRKFANFISKKANISGDAVYGIGNIFQLGVKIMKNVRIGDHCKINIDSTIHHDCNVGNFNTLAPGVRLLGNVIIGNNVFIGSNAIVLPGIKIGNNCIIGAGSLVNRNVSNNNKVFGVPAK